MNAYKAVWLYVTALAAAFIGMTWLQAHAQILKYVPDIVLDRLKCDVPSSKGPDFENIVVSAMSRGGFKPRPSARPMTKEDPLQTRQNFVSGDFSSVEVTPDWGTNVPFGTTSVPNYEKQFVSFFYYPKGPDMAKFVQETEASLELFNCQHFEE